MEKIQGTFTAGIDELLSAFLRDRRAAGCAPSTLLWYKKKLAKFSIFMNANGISFGNAKPDDIRCFLLWLQENGHNPGGVHGHFRAVRAFYHWCEQEFDYTSPIF